jgi:YidC/Oxa1 family membrane protein insertase
MATAFVMGGAYGSRRHLSLWGWGNGGGVKPSPAAETSAASIPADATASSVASAATPVEVPRIPTEIAQDAAPAPIDASILPELDATSILNMPEHIGYLSSLGLDFGWGPSSTMQWLLEHVHIYSGMPWWGTIAVTSLLIRIALWKPLRKAHETSAKLAVLKQNPRYNELQKEMQQMVQTGQTDKLMMVRQELGLIHKEAGVQPILSMVMGLIQLPIGIGMFRVLRGMSDIPVPALETGGLLWFSDLAVPDPLFVLPVLGPIMLVGMMRVSYRKSP